MSPPTHQPEYGTVAAELALLRHEMSQNTVETRKITHLLTGNGEPHKGVIVRLDRLEQTDARHGVIVNAALGASVVAILGTAWAKLTGKV